MAMNTRDSARWWISERDVLIAPAPFQQKGVTLPDWTKLRITLDTVDQYFNGGPQNLAILMGEPRNLADVDIDCPEARWAWLEYGPPTGLNWGRASNPNSHHLYFTEPMALTAKYLDPTLEKDNPGDACLVELRCRTKAGAVGYATIAPPSVHPSGEPYEFVGGAGAPAAVNGPWLGERVRLCAAASMLGRHARDGACHEIFIALAGVMARAKWDLAEAQRFLRAVYRVKWHETAQISQANADADSTYQHFDDGKETTGMPRLAELLDDRVFKRLKEWLGLEWQDGAARQQPPPRKTPRVLPASEPVEQLRSQVIPGAVAQIEECLPSPGLVLLVGESKSGKTVLGMQMVMTCANQLSLFDNYSAKQANGLIVEWDDRRGKASIKEFVERTRASRSNQPIGYSVNEQIDLDFTLADPEFAPWLRKLIQKHQAKVVLLDSYTALRGFHSGGRDVVKVEAAELLLLHQLALEMNCAVLLIHHTSKGSAHLDRHSRAAGSFAMQAVSEAQIVVERFRDLSEADPMRLVSVRGRHLRGTQMALRFREESLDFDWVLDGPAAEEFPRLRLLLHAFRGKSFSAADVTKEIGWAKTQVYGLMSRLLASGVVTKESAAWGWNPVWGKTLERI